MTGGFSATDTSKTIVVLVGACAIDTILTVPYFPGEDSKLRAVSSIKRRGGNCPNTLEVLHQLIQFQKVLSPKDESNLSEIGRLVLVSPMPSKSSPIMPFMYDSFRISGKDSKIDFSHCIFREDHVDPVSSYIISSQLTGSRTIVSHSPLPEMTLGEFSQIADSLLGLSDDSAGSSAWYHFEGRIPETTLACMKYLRRTWRRQNGDRKLTISVELEKPGRQGLQDLATEADVILYSRSWAEGEGYSSASECLLGQASMLENTSLSQQLNRTLVCTWDKSGACGLRTQSRKISYDLEVVYSQARAIAEAEIVDTVGAGDTFIAGMIFGMLDKGKDWCLQQQLDFANSLAGSKILQHGFSGLAEQFADQL